MTKRGFWLCCLTFGLLTLALVATAQTPDNFWHLSGYAWSSNIGWVSVAGVKIDKTSGDFSGYGWSSNIGWINFDPVGTPPAAPSTSAHIAVANGAIANGTPVTGWIRACSVFASSCAGALKSPDVRGGWDGWIKMSGTSPAYAVTKTSVGSQDQLSGFAWGDLVVGWLNFNNVTIGTTAPTPPAPTISCDVNPSTATIPANGKLTFTGKWTVNASGATPANYCWGTGCHNPAITGDVNQDQTTLATIQREYSTDPDYVNAHPGAMLVRAGQRVRGEAQATDSTGAPIGTSCEATININAGSGPNNPPGGGANDIKVDLQLRADEPGTILSDGPLSVSSTTPITLHWSTLGTPTSCEASGGFSGDNWSGSSRSPSTGDFDVSDSVYPQILPGGHADATYTIVCHRAGSPDSQDSVDVKVTYEDATIGHLVPVPPNHIIRITSQITGQSAHSTVGKVRAEGGTVSGVRVISILRAAAPNTPLITILSGRPAPECRLWIDGDPRPTSAQSCASAVIPQLPEHSTANLEVEIPGGSKLRRVTENSPYKVKVGNGDPAQDTDIIFEYRVPNIQEF